MRLIAEGISHSYDGMRVLEDISLAFPAGGITCICGPSGCGKSTLLRLLGGLERPAAGAVLQAGAPPRDCLNPLTYIFQDFALLPWRTVAGNVTLALEPHRLSRRRRREIVDDVLARTRLSEFRDALPRQISGGMKQRVAIARALAVSPAVLLMDEPLSALDAQTRELLIDDLIALYSRAPFTAVYVTHNLAEAVRLGHRIVLLSRRPGRVRHIAEITTPLARRQVADPALEAQSRRLWEMLRDEAREADRELVDG